MGSGNAHSQSNSGHDHAGHAHPHPPHNHGHTHLPASYGRAFLIGIILNTGFVIVEATYGWISGSMALIADAGHNLSDVLALIVAWVANIASTRAASERFTYGYKSSTILAAMTNAALLFIAIGAILFETIRRIAEPAPVEGMTMVIVASIGVGINTITALLFLRGQQDDLNIHGAFLHMAADALVSLGVVIAGIAIIFTGQNWIDPVVSLMIVAVITWGTWRLAKDSFKMGLHAVPEGISQEAVRSYLNSLPGVESVEDLHIWPMSTTETALSAHLVIPGGHPGDGFLKEINSVLEREHRISHSTIQIEQAAGCGGGC